MGKSFDIWVGAAYRRINYTQRPASIAFEHPHDAKNKAHFAEIDKEFSEYKPLPLQVAQKNLVEVLEALSGLVNLRILPLDYTKYLSGCLTPEQHGFIIPTQDFMYGEGARHHSFHVKHLPAPGCYRLYSFLNAEVTATILRAFQEAKIVIRDLRCSARPLPLQHICALPTSFPSLRTLRIAVHVRDIFDFLAIDYKSLFLEALRNMKDLKELVIKLTGVRTDRNVSLKRKIVAAILFAAVSGATKLQRVALRGDWTCSQTVLLNFVEHHASTLRYFMLIDFTLDGRWLEILHRLADSTRGKLQYLSIKRPMAIQKWNNDVSSKDAKFKKYRHNLSRFRSLLPH